MESRVFFFYTPPLCYNIIRRGFNIRFMVISKNLLKYFKYILLVFFIALLFPLVGVASTAGGSGLNVTGPWIVPPPQSYAQFNPDSNSLYVYITGHTGGRTLTCEGNGEYIPSEGDLAYILNNNLAISESDIGSLYGKDISVTYLGGTGAIGECGQGWGFGAWREYEGNRTFDASSIPDGDHFIVVRVRNTIDEGNFLDARIPFTISRPATCTDPTANNNGQAGACDYTYGCTDPNATNYNPDPLTIENGSCVYPQVGTVCIKSNVNTQVDTSRTGGAGYSDNVTGGAPYTCHDNAPLDTYTANGVSLANYTGPTYNSQSLPLSTNGQTIYFDLTYVGICSGDPTQSCTSGFNSCNQTTGGIQTRTCTNGTWSDWSACDASIPPTPTPTACTSSANACGQTGNNTATCGDTCTATPPPTPPPTTCTSSPNACGQTADATATCGDTCVATPPPNTCTPTVTLTASPNPVTYGTASTLTWDSTKTVANSCAFTVGAGSVDGSTTNLPVSGSRPTKNLTANTPFTITCTGLDGSLKSASVTVNVGGPPVMNSFTCTTGFSGTVATNGTCYVDRGGSAEILWSSSNTTGCSLTSTVPTDDYVVPTGSRIDTGIIANRNYSLECWNGTSNSHAPALVMPLHVVVNGPTVDIKANGTYNGVATGLSNGPISVDWGTNPALSWTVANAGSCTASATPASGNWSGNPDASTGTHSQSTGSLIVPQTNTYTIACTGNGSASDSVVVTVGPPVPNNPTNVTIQEPDYCSSGPAVTVSWAYSDPTGSTQNSAYQVQIDDQGSFNSINVDSCPTGPPSGTCAPPNNTSNSWFSGQGVLSFNTVYHARVRYWNSYGVVSNWQSATVCSGPGCTGGGSDSWKTPAYAYPDVVPPYQFTWPTVPKPQQSKPLQFTDHVVFGGGNSNSRQWNWNFKIDGASIGTSTAQNPSFTFSNVGTYQVTETVTDAANQSCSYMQPVNIIKPIPIIKEVAPR